MSVPLSVLLARLDGQLELVAMRMEFMPDEHTKNLDALRRAQEILDQAREAQP